MKRSAAALVLALALALALGAAWLLRPLDGVPDFVRVRDGWRSSEGYLLDRHGDVLDSVRLDFGARRLAWVPLADVSPALVAAVVQGEDRRFRDHDGIDWIGVGAALRDRAQGRPARGASTITMQLATLLDPRVQAARGRPWQRKLLQMRAARAIESRWSKDQILEAYLNLLGFRGELQGIGAAAALLAGKAPSGLDRDESVTLAALLPAPRASLERVTARACARARAIEANADCAGLHATAERLLRRAHVRDIVATSTHLAAHATRALVQRAGERVESTLDARVQRLAVAALDRQLADLGSRNVRDGAAIVVDNGSGDVLAYVGSAGPASTARAVDGVRARRQAGSTLKPFLYALALERGYLTAASLLDDSPLNLDTASGLYLPQNYDRAYKGRVSVRTALASSLNVPAVRTLVLVGVQSFHTRLRALGYDGLTEDGEFYGYSLALGSAEVSLWEQARAYRALARGGRFAPLHMLRAQPVSDEARDASAAVMNEAAAFVVTDILADRAARAPTFGIASHLDTPFFTAVKTGTSKSMRDNWCIGFSARYTVAVWVGNFEGDSMREVSGVTGAAPVWQEIMLGLHERESSRAPRPPAGVRTVLTRFTPAVEPPRNEWYLAETAVPVVAAVPHDGAMPRIASPANGMVIAIDPDIPAARQRVPLEARGATGAMRLRLNGALVGAAARPVLWRPRPGAHRLALEDTRGRVLDRVLFTVR